MWAICSTAKSNASALAWEGFVVPAILRTYCNAAAWTSSEVAAGSKLWRVRMFLHMIQRYPVTLTRDRDHLSASCLGNLPTECLEGDVLGFRSPAGPGVEGVDGGEFGGREFEVEDVEVLGDPRRSH